jgi:hypothetical protein
MDSPVFILSTGRTGTRFFEDYLNQTTDRAICRHEPSPSRRFKFLSNLYLNHKTGTRRIIRIYLWSRRRLFRETGGRTYVESSNFMFGCIPALNEHFEQIRIIHIVRDPVTYVKSHLNHGFWRGHKKFFAKHVPYWLEKLEVEDRSDPLQLLAARWNLVNSQIRTYAGTNPYLLVRFEELFSKDLKSSSARLNEIREFCGLAPIHEEENIRWLSQPKNISKRKVQLTSPEEALIREKTGPLMKELYAAP